MQNMTKTMNLKVDSIHHTTQTSSNLKMVVGNSKKCCKRRHRNQCNFNEVCVQVDNHHNANNLTKPCSVILTKLNLSPHNGNKSSNCLALPQKNDSSVSITSKEVAIEHSYSMVENKDLNSSGRNGDSIKKQMDLLFERLCETFRLLKAKKKKNKQAKKVKNVPFFYSAEKLNASIAPIDNLFQGKNEITKTMGNKKSENAFNNKSKITILKKNSAQKNLKGAAKNYSAAKELLNENPACMPNLNIKNSGKDDIPLVENIGSQILKHTVKNNLSKATKKYPVTRSVSAIQKKLHGRENIKCLEDACSIGTKEYNNISTVTRDESNNVLQMEIVNKQETECCISSADHSISSTVIDKISNGSITSGFTVSDSKAFKYLGKTLLIRPCSVVIDKLPVECHENTSCSVVRNGSCNLEAKYVSQCGKSLCTASDSAISSTKVDEIPNTNDNDTVEVDEMLVKDDDVSAIPDVDDDISSSDEIPDVDDDISEIDEIPDIDDDIPFNDEFPDIDEGAPAFNECIACHRIPFENAPMNEPVDVPRPNLEMRSTPLPCFILVADFKHKLSAEEYAKYFIPLRKKKEEKLKRKKMRIKKRRLLERNEFVKEWLLKNEETAKKC